MSELVLFCVPTVICRITQSRSEDRSFRTARHRAGLSRGAPVGKDLQRVGLDNTVLFSAVPRSCRS